MILIFLGLFAGIFAGVITGLFPGIHLNLIAVISAAMFFNLGVLGDPFPVIVFLVSMTTVHSFVDFIPSIFLGAPSEDTALGVLPGHKLLLKGKGYFAIKLTVIGSLLGLISVLFLTPLFLFFLPKVYPFISKIIPFILIAASSFLLLKEIKNKKFFWSLFLFLISGVLGYFTLNFSLIKQPLLPLFSGLFGVSLLVRSIIKKTKIPKQDVEEEKISNKEVFSGFFPSLISAPLCSFLPGLGSSQAAVIGSSFKKTNQKSFLVLLGAINTLVLCLSFISLYVIGKGRTGVAATVKTMIDYFSLNRLLFLLGVMIFVGGLSVFITLIIAKKLSKIIHKVNYRKLSAAIILLIALISFLISGPFSLLILVTGSAIGILCSEKQVRKMHLMGSLIIPTVLFML